MSFIPFDARSCNIFDRFWSCQRTERKRHHDRLKRVKTRQREIFVWSIMTTMLTTHANNTLNCWKELCGLPSSTIVRKLSNQLSLTIPPANTFRNSSSWIFAMSASIVAIHILCAALEISIDECVSIGRTFNSIVEDVAPLEWYWCNGPTPNPDADRNKNESKKTDEIMIDVFVEI